MLLRSLKAEDAAQDKATTAAEAHATAVKNLTAALEEDFSAAQRSNQGTAGGAYEQKLAEIEHAKQMRLLQIDKIKGTKEEIETMKQLAEATAHERRVEASKEVPVPTGKGAPTQRQAETESMEQLGKDQLAISETHERKLEADAKKQYDIMIEPWKRLAGDVGTLTGNMFDKMLQEGKVSFKELGTSFSDIFRTAITGSIGNIVAKPLVDTITKIGDAASSDSQGLLSGVTKYAGEHPYAVSAAAGAVGGYVAGSIYASVAKLKPGNQAALGGAIGGAAGGAIGFSVGGAGGAVVGSTLGATAGSVLGSFLGGENNLGNDRSSQVYASQRRQILYSDKSYADENRTVTQGIIEQAKMLQMGLESLGETFRKFQLRVEAGNKTGITVNGKKYDNAQDAIIGTIEFLLTKSTGGLSTTQETILKNTKGTSAQEILADVGFAKTYDQLTYSGNQFDQQLRDMNETFRDASIKAGDLKLDIGALASAEAKAQGEIARQRDQATRSVSQQIAQARGDNSLGTQLYALETDMRELGKAAGDLGISLSEVTQAHQMAADAIVRAHDQMVRGVQGQIMALTSGNDLNTQLFNLETQMRELAVSAQAAGIPLEQVTAAHQAAANQLIQQDAQRRQQEAQAEADRKRQEAERQQQAAEQARQAAEQRRAEAAAAREAAFRRGQDARGLYSQFAQLAGDKSLKLALFDLNTQFIEIAHSAQELGVPLSKVWAAQRNAAAELIRQYQQNVRGVVGQIASARGDNSLKQQLYDLQTTFNDLAISAANLNIPMKAVQQAQAAAAQELYRQYQQNVRGVVSQLASLRGDENLSTRLYELQTQFNELAKSAAELNIPMKAVQDAQRDAIIHLVETYDKAIADLRKQQGALDQSLKDANRSAFQVVDQFLDPIKEATGAFGIGQGVFSQAATAKGGMEEFRKVLQLAQGGDTGALGQLAGVGQQALQAGRAFGASGPEFAAMFKEVNQGLLGIQGDLEAKRTQLMQKAVDYGRETVNELIRLRVETIRELQEQREQLRRDLALAIERRVA
jgi:hypothetical protein